MKASIYFKYTTRSLQRGGQRTVLAIFCVAVGVLAIVSLQLVGIMINRAFTSNVRDANGGDVAVTSLGKPFTATDLSFFQDLKRRKTIVGYTPTISVTGSTSFSASLTQSFTLKVVDPHSFPVVSQPTFTSPQNGTITGIVEGAQVVVTQGFVDQYQKTVGDRLRVFVGGQNTSGRTLDVRIAGVIDNAGLAAQAGSTMYLAIATYQAASPKAPLLYDTIYVSTGEQDALTTTAVHQIQARFPVSNTQTAADALRANQTQVDFIRKFLEIAGLLALLIGGVGIVNTMQVLLSRRRVEIAMLKTTGYRRVDLYLLFGLEASLLGLMGGVIGAAVGIGVSALVRLLVERTFYLNIPFVIDPLTVGGGVLIGLFTALIFGLLPIVQAANIRPLNVIRELPEGRGVARLALTAGLLVLLSIFFCILAIVVLNNDVLLGVSVVYGAFALLGLLSLVFGLVTFVVSILPVPERFSVSFLGLIVVAMALSGLLVLVLPAIGYFLLAVSILSITVLFLPRSWKANLKMALRNIGRQRTRTTTTMLALFVGIFTIGLILVLGQDLRTKINDAIATNLHYNVIAISSGPQAQSLQANLNKIPGLKNQRHTLIAASVPLSIDNQPIQVLLPPSQNSDPSAGGLGRTGALSFLSSMEGYDVGNNQLPDPRDVTIRAGGRNLNASDAGTTNVLVPSLLATQPPLKGHLHIGSLITFASADGLTVKTARVVGFYRSSLGNSLAQILTTADFVRAFSPGGVTQSVFYMKVDPKQIGPAVNTIGQYSRNATVINLASIGDFINQILSYMLLTLTAIASLSLFAGVIIIANAVALAMLERRRELGILKSVGYTSRSILSEVVIENSLVGGLGALLAMVLMTIAVNLLGTYFFKTPFDVSQAIVIELILGSALLALLTAVLVAWRAVRVRPLEVLRYE